ncbi:beta-glucosidase family protein [Sphaerotilus sp.]|uniref:beta-glucosidase family protein n=1 Tax=Sphaerotilus sp. TaxID=2093942 RepID=UPI0025F292D4|nr:glycoside hydrolase family 3 C-terminal domain-containing protein [Sphaerotilus sp.]
MNPTLTSLISGALVACTLTGCGGGDNTQTTVVQPTADTVADDKASALLAQMTLDEKIQLVHGNGFGNSPVGGAGWIPGIARLGIPELYTADSAAGVGVTGKNVTPMPAPIALAASWDPKLAFEYGETIAKELRALGFYEGLGGGVNLAREPRNGRNFEYMGEDPVLAGELVAQRTIGTHSQKVVATLKHYALNDQEVNRFTSNSEVDERTMRELYLLPFEIGVKQGEPGNVMCSYNLVNGLHACQNPYLLTDVLKKEWGFKGKVQSDWFLALTDTVQAATAGLDEEQAGSPDDSAGIFGWPTFFNQKLKTAVQSGSVPLSRLNDMVFRKLRTLARVGILESPPKAGGTIDQAAGSAAALKFAQQSMVLLKNTASTGSTSKPLPLNAGSVRSIVVIGGHADVAVLSGGGSASVAPRDGDAVPCLKPGTVVGNLNLFNACATWYKSSPLDAIRAKAPTATVTYFDGNDAVAAATAAAAADVAIVFGTQWQTEDADLSNLSLPDAVTDPANQSYDQNALIAAVAAKAKQTVVVLETGTAVTMPWVGNVNSVLEAWYPGVKGGQAIADVLFGDVNPSGKLPQTFPVREADLPQTAISKTSLNVQYLEGLAMGYRWFDARQITPLFPFGHGLSYTDFSYSGIQTSMDAAGNLTVNFTLKNIGGRAGAEVAQVYAGLPSNSGEPPKRLVGWQKISLAAGASQAVSLTIKAERLSVWDTSKHQWQLPSGSFTFYVGGSSRDNQSLVAFSGK